MNTRPTNSRFICVQSSILPDKEYSWEDIARNIYFKNQEIQKSKSNNMESFVIQRAIQLLNDGLASQELNPSILYAELQELLLLEKQNLESAYRWGFNDGCRYTNRVNPFYVTANDFVTKNFR